MHESIEKKNPDEIPDKAEHIGTRVELGEGDFGFDILEAAVEAEKDVEENTSDDKGDDSDRPSPLAEPNDVLMWALENAEDGVLSSEDLDLILESFDNKKKENKKEKIQET